MADNYSLVFYIDESDAENEIIGVVSVFATEQQARNWLNASSVSSDIGYEVVRPIHHSRAEVILSPVVREKEASEQVG